MRVTSTDVIAPAVIAFLTAWFIGMKLAAAYLVTVAALTWYAKRAKARKG